MKTPPQKRQFTDSWAVEKAENIIQDIYVAMWFAHHAKISPEKSNETNTIGRDFLVGTLEGAMVDAIKLYCFSRCGGFDFSGIIDIHKLRDEISSLSKSNLVYPDQPIDVLRSEFKKVGLNAI